MFSKVLITIVIIPILCSAKIKIEIKPASNFDDAKVQVNGYDDKLVTDKEIGLFNVTKNNLIKGVRVELGRYPRDVFLRDPTPYEDLFKEYEWEEVKRHLKVSKIKILQIVKEEIDLSVREIVNTATSTIHTKAKLFQELENTVSSSWSEKGLPLDDIFYDIGIEFGKTIIKYENRWRNDSLRIFNVKFGAQREGTMKILPGQTVITKLTAFKTIMLIELEYTATLIGQVITDFEELEGFHYHFFAPSVGNIMKAANISNEVKTTEWIEIRCYTEPRLRVYNKDTGFDVSFNDSKKDFITDIIK